MESKTTTTTITTKEDPKDIIAVISRCEADLLRILRQYSFGQFTVSPVVDGISDNNRRIRIVKKDDSPAKVVIEFTMSISSESGLRLDNAILATNETKTMKSLVEELISKVRLS